MSQTSLVQPGTVGLILVAIAAWASNPDEEHFRRHLARQAGGGADSLWQQLAARAAANLVAATIDVDRTNYGFASVIVVGTPRPVVLFGAFGHWWVVPADKEPSEKPAPRR